MGSSFGSLEIPKTGLFLSREALEVIGHNIANADTEGYTRQRLVTQSIDPYANGSRFLGINTSKVGRGVESVALDQIRSKYLDKEYRSESSDYGMWDTRTEELEYIETLFSEDTDSSISKALADFYDSLNELSMDPVSEEIRTNVQQNAINLTETVNHYYNKLVGLQDAYNDKMAVVTEQINDYLTTIGDYNNQIYGFELSGEKANDLRDKRNLALDKLSEMINIEYEENTDGELQVSVDGVMLVDHIDVTKLEARPDLTGVVSGQPDYYEIYLEGTPTVFTFSSGELKAYQDLRDGATLDDFGVPTMLDELNTLARSLAEEFNTVNNAGYTIPYGAIPSQTGIDLFEVPAGGYTDITAGNLEISTEFRASVYNLATSDQLVDLTAANTQQNNNVNALELLALTTKTDIATVGSFEEYLNSLVVKTAIESAHASKMSESQYYIVANVQNRRQSMSGVSVDEEMVEMIKYQHAYTAASRIITTMDEALDVLINRTGLVGR